MYVPKKFSAPSLAETEAVIRNNSFGIIITPDLQATHVPMELVKQDDGNSLLEGHLSAANPQGNVLDGRQVLAIFQGPHTYVSSSWYGEVNVPTWNYIAVHVFGKAVILNAIESRELIERQLKKYESMSKSPMTIEKMGDVFLESHLKGITCFRISVERMEPAFKLSQNRNDGDYRNIIGELEKSNDTQSQGVAEYMKKLRP